jgi:hypothetical protein
MLPSGKCRRASSPAGGAALAAGESMGHGRKVPLWGLLPLVNKAAVELVSDERWVGPALTPLLSLETFCADLRLSPLSAGT